LHKVTLIAIPFYALSSGILENSLNNSGLTGLNCPNQSASESPHKQHFFSTVSPRLSQVVLLSEHLFK